MICAVLAAAGNQASGSTVWGTVPAWFSAIGTVSAFSVTFGLFLREWRERIREQANQVYAWEDRRQNRDGSLSVTGQVFNKSKTPIENVVLKPLRAGSVYNTPVTQTYVDIRPGSSASWEWTARSEDVAALSRRPQLEFTDAAGRRWRKVGSKLEKRRG
jgi:hypothetical protein